MFYLAISTTSCYKQSPPLLIQALHDCFSIAAVTADISLASITLAHCAKRKHNYKDCIQIGINRTDVDIIGCATTHITQGQVYSKASSNHQGTYKASYKPLVLNGRQPSPYTLTTARRRFIYIYRAYLQQGFNS
jgi:hypothetical protein